MRGILYGGGRELPLCEIEVELKSGLPEETVAYGMALARGFGLRPQSFGKYIRALVLSETGNAL